MDLVEETGFIYSQLQAQYLTNDGFYFWSNYNCGSCIGINNIYAAFGINPGEATLESDLGNHEPYTANFSVNVQIGGATGGGGNKNAVLGGIQVNGAEQRYASFYNNVKSIHLMLF